MTQKVNRKYKDRLFRMVFNNKKDLLDLYNAIRGSHYTDCEELEITTIEDVIYIGMKNDLSFLIDDVLNLYEHQSTYNPNMPIRGFLYLSDMEHCAKLKQYAQFVDRIRTYQARDMTLAEAANIAVDECIKEGILAEFLSAHRAEVIDIILTEYDEQAHIASEKELSLQEGLEQGQLLMSQLYKLLQKDGRPEEYEKALDDLNYRKELFQSYHLL